jgi:hypothetical protein
LKTCGRGAAFAADVPQQIRAWPEQSSSVLHAFGHVDEQMPLQQSWPVAAQSLDAWQALGHVSYCGLRQRPAAVTVGSTLCTEVQQTSPKLVWQSVLVLHALGHWFEPVQIPCP